MKHHNTINYSVLIVGAVSVTFSACGTPLEFSSDIESKSTQVQISPTLLENEDVAEIFNRQAKNASAWTIDSSFGDNNLRVFTYTTATQKRWLAVARLNSVVLKPRLAGESRIAPTSQIGGNCRVAVNAGYFSFQSQKPSSIYVEDEKQLGLDEQKIARPGGTANPTRAVFGESTSGWEFRWARTMEKNIFSYPSPADPWKTPESGTPWKLKNAIGAGPMLIQNARSSVTATSELFDTQSGVDPEGKQPRTAVALGSNGLLYFVVVDGRRTDATGINLKDLSILLLDIGAKDGMNLDGGGSSTFVTNGRVLNKPSDRQGERAVSSIFCVR